jgi:hypothetical protein
MPLLERMLLFDIMYIRNGCENKRMDSYQTGVTDQHRVWFKSH